MRNVELHEKEALLKDLEDARQRFNKAKENVERLRNQIAVANCPVSVGETVPLTKDGKDFEGNRRFDTGEARLGRSAPRPSSRVDRKRQARQQDNRRRRRMGIWDFE